MTNMNIAFGDRQPDVFIVRPLDGLWYVVNAEFPSVLTTLPFVTHAEAEASARERTARDARQSRMQVVFTGPRCFS